MLGRDKLHDIGAIAQDAQDQRAKGIGQDIAQAMLENAIVKDWSERRDRVQLLLQVVMAAGSAEDQPRLVPDALEKRLVGRGVAGMQGKHDIGSDRGLVVDDGGTLETGPGETKLRALGVILADQRFVDIDTYQACRDAAHIVEIVVGREREIGRAAAAVEDLYRP